MEDQVSILAPLFIGQTVATALWGVTCVQAWTYFTSPQGTRGDSRKIQSVVAILWFFDTIHEIVTTDGLYGYCVTNFGDFEKLNVLPKGAWLQSFLVQVVALLVHGMYIYKIWRLSKHALLFTIPLVTIKVAQVVVVIINTKLVSGDDTWTVLFETTRLWTTMINAFDLVMDVTIAAVLYYLLATNESEYEKTRSMIKRIMIFTLSTNTITSLCALVILITAVVIPDKPIFLGFFFVKSRLYVNSLMASLNFRPYLKGMGGGVRTLDQESTGINVPVHWSRLQGGETAHRRQHDVELEDAHVAHSKASHPDALQQSGRHVMIHIDKHHE